MLKISKIPNKIKASVFFSPMFSLLKITDRASLPFAVSNPVFNTMATAPPSGLSSVTKDGNFSELKVYKTSVPQ